MSSQPHKDAPAKAASEQTHNPHEEAKAFAKEDVKFLWDEYKYRHDLCWKTTIQITAAFVALSIIPYLHKEVVRALGRAVIAVPFLALALVGFAIPVMINELILFGEIKRKYREKQRIAYCIQHKEYFSAETCNLLRRLLILLRINTEAELDSFSCFVLIYLLILFLLCGVNLVYVFGLWVPYVNSLPCELFTQ